MSSVQQKVIYIPKSVTPHILQNIQGFDLTFNPEERNLGYIGFADTQVPNGGPSPPLSSAFLNQQHKNVRMVKQDYHLLWSLSNIALALAVGLYGFAWPTPLTVPLEMLQVAVEKLPSRAGSPCELLQSHAAQVFSANVKLLERDAAGIQLVGVQELPPPTAQRGDLLEKTGCFGLLLFPASLANPGRVFFVVLSQKGLTSSKSCDLDTTKSPGPEPAHQPCVTMSQQENDKMLTSALARNSDKFLLRYDLNLTPKLLQNTKSITWLPPGRPVLPCALCVKKLTPHDVLLAFWSSGFKLKPASGKMAVRLRTHLVVLHLWLPKGIVGIAGSPCPPRMNASLFRQLKVRGHVAPQEVDVTPRADSVPGMNEEAHFVPQKLLMAMLPFSSMS
ncbi:hypothetical protein A6R68_17406 [Neotoma lepida]|uniref:Uncharacterized protein n=1 Tax=Neotoma lepida TaxID=56216 RepID=A0A1A6HCZ0_NEOLE|nr:hypothetical protein A6R68_17406 [Neotoma lepida]